MEPCNALSPFLQFVAIPFVGIVNYRLSSSKSDWNFSKGRIGGMKLEATSGSFEQKEETIKDSIIHKNAKIFCFSGLFSDI